MTSPLVRPSRARGVDVVVLDSPDNRNALSIRMLEELVAAVAASATGDGRALLLDHTGPAFCAGVDLRERRELGPDDGSHSTLLSQLLRELWLYPKPLLCRLDGAVRGGGMGLVACADVVVASPRATFAYSEVRVGVAPVLVAAVALAKVPVASLLPWLLTGEVFDAQTAQSLGLVTRVDDAPATVGPSLDRELDALRLGAPKATTALKTMVRRVQGVDIDALMAEMGALSQALFRDPEAQEGMLAFAERRSPGWVAPVAD